MKVIMVAPHFKPRIGGVETYTFNIATRLVELGWQVVIVTTGGRRAVRLTSEAGMKVYRLPVTFTVSNTPVGLLWRRRLRKIFADERPDVINGHTPVPYLADMAQRASKSVPFILTYHNDLDKDALILRVIVRVLHRVLIAPTLRRSTGVIATSEYYIDESRYLREYRPKTRVIPPGVDLNSFNPQVQVAVDLAARYTGLRIILFVGSLNKSQQYKGLDILIKAFARIRRDKPDLRLVVVGEGDGLDIYRRGAAAIGVADAVIFAGYIGHDRLAEYYKLATLLAMPSTSRTEGFGMVYIEAGAVGIPVVGSRIGGVPCAIRHDETGLLVTPNSIDELADALLALLDDHALATRLGEAGAARARTEFDWRLLAERTSEIFKELSTTR
jgi:glycosyltransferase involved in cell wall biosynthesis